MTHRTTILRDQQDDVTSWNQTDEPDWQSAAINVPCRAFYQNGSETIDGTKTANVDQIGILFPSGTDVKPSDRIGDVTDRLGAVLFRGPHRIESVGYRADHITATLQAV